MKVFEEYEYMGNDIRLKLIEIWSGKQLRYYSYTIQEYSLGIWVPRLRVDNYGMIDHIDIYDESGNHITRKACKRLEKAAFVNAAFEADGEWEKVMEAQGVV